VVRGGLSSYLVMVIAQTDDLCEVQLAVDRTETISCGRRVRERSVDC